MDAAGWTVDTLRAHLEDQIRLLREWLDERYTTQLRERDEEIREIRALMERFETASGQHLLRTEYDMAHQALIRKIEVEADHTRDALAAINGELAVMRGAVQSTQQATTLNFTRRSQVIMALGVMVSVAAASGLFDWLFQR
jgi:hypothetical protein